MIDKQKWQSLLKEAENMTVICLASGEDYLLSNYATQLLHHLQAVWEDSEVTRIQDDVFSMEEIVAAAGTISFFATKRIIFLPYFPFTSLDENTAQEFCDVLRSTENAVFIITLLRKSGKGNKGAVGGRDEKAEQGNRKEKGGKKVTNTKMLEAVAAECGAFMELITPSEGEMSTFVQQLAAGCGATIKPAVAQELVESVGSDMGTLASEVAKLCAGVNYGEITAHTVRTLAVHTVEADVFKMADAVVAGQVRQAFGILNGLLYLHTEPVAICAALSSSFISMARVRAAALQHVGYAVAFKELKYTGNDYRFKKALENAMRYTPAQLWRTVDILAQLDADLKSSPVENNVLLQTALCELCNVKRTA